MEAHCVDPEKDRLLSLPLPILLVAAAILIDKDNKILLAKRPKAKAMAGFWEFPGGKVHEKEAPEMALVRELKEELGITVSSGCLLPFSFASHRYEKFHLLMPVFLCRNWQGSIKAKEGQGLIWIKIQELRHYPMPPANDILISMLYDYFTQ